MTTASRSLPKKVKTLKWMPKTNKGDPAHVYSRNVMLHWYSTWAATTTTTTKDTDSGHQSCTTTQTKMTVKMAPRAPSPSKSHKSQKSQRNGSIDETDTQVDPSWTEGYDTTGVFSAEYDPSWCSAQVMNGLESPKLEPQAHPSAEVPEMDGYEGYMGEEEYWDYYGLQAQEQMDQWVWPITSLIMLNIPTKYTPLEMVEVIKAQPFGEGLNFLYLPRDPNKEDANWGTCTANFTSVDLAQACYDYFSNAKCSVVLSKHASLRSVKVFPARMQGIEWNLEELRRDPILEKLEAESKWRPLLFENGTPMPFTVARRHAKRTSTEAETRARLPRYPSEPVNPEEHTTIMMRNIPNKYTRSMLHDRLKELFDPMDYNFIYMPIDFVNKCNVGYAFVNFRKKEGVQKALELFHNVECQKALPGFNSQKVVELTPARVQGLDKNVEHLQHSEVLGYMRDHNDWTPLVFDDAGNMTPFPILDSSVHKKSRGDSSSKGSRGKKQWTPGGGTTMMISNIPGDCTLNQLVDTLNSADLKGEYDFIHMPVDYEMETHYGYAYVNFRHETGAAKLAAFCQGKKALDVFPKIALNGDVQVFRMASDATVGDKNIEVTSAPVQGLDSNIGKVKESISVDVLKAVPDSIPLVFDANGDRIAFPVESGKLRVDAPEFTPPNPNALRPDAAPFVPSSSPKSNLKQITECVEHYLSDSNLTRDVFLRSHMDAEGFVKADMFIRFPRLVKLGATRELLTAAVEASTIVQGKYLTSQKGYAIRIKDPARRVKWIQK